MREIDYKYGLAIEMLAIGGEDYLKDSIKQAINISNELNIKINLKNPINNKSAIVAGWSDYEEILKEII